MFEAKQKARSSYLKLSCLSRESALNRTKIEDIHLLTRKVHEVKDTRNIRLLMSCPKIGTHCHLARSKLKNCPSYSGDYCGRQKKIKNALAIRTIIVVIKLTFLQRKLFHLIYLLHEVT